MIACFLSTSAGLDEAGFTLLESLLATSLLVVVLGAVFGVMNPDTSIATAEPEAMDMQQRARVGADALVRDLLAAGAGMDDGPANGPLDAYFAPVIPRVMGTTNPDAYTTSRSDVLTLVSVPQTMTQSVTTTPIGPGSQSVTVADEGNCRGRALCGLSAGMEALTFDPAGNFSVFSVASVDATAAHLVHRGGVVTDTFQPGAYLTEVNSHTYYFDVVNHVLRHYDGYSTDTPVVDDVVDVRFDYFGDAEPPRSPKPPAGTANCLYDAYGNVRDGLVELPAAGTAAVPLPLSMFSDGPWCGVGDDRFDADLLRVRRIRVTLRIQAAPASLRGLGHAFLVPGTSASALHALPDYTLVSDVSPRNMNPGR